MNKKDNIKLRVLSNIADDIIERNSRKRFLLMSMMTGTPPKKSRAKTMKTVTAIAAIALVAALSVFLILQMIGIGKQVPVYLGMSVHQTKSAALASVDGEHILLDASGNPSGGTTAESTEESTTEEGKELPVTFDEMYYVTAGCEAYVKIHFENPDDFEILSFTLGGKKYASHMFEEGSDMENLIVKIDIPADAEGILEYTIDAIKYVDGTSIKDVRMKGDDTVIVGIKTTQQPTVTVTREMVGFDYMYLEMTVKDKKNLIEKTKGDAQVILYDESGTAVSAVAIKTNQENLIRFENLGNGRAYTYKVVFAYDDLQGVGFQRKTFASNTLVTEDYLLAEFTTETEGASYRIRWNEAVENGTLESLALYDGDNLLRTLTTDMEGTLSDLLSNHTYRLEATVKVGGESYPVRLTFATKAKQVPDVYIIQDLTPGYDSFTFDLDITDPDGVLKIEKILLVGNDGERVAEDLNVRKFDGLFSGENYRLTVHYSYDLNDGRGVRTAGDKMTFKTALKRPYRLSVVPKSGGVTSVAFDFELEDLDHVVTFKKIELLRDGVVVRETEDVTVRSFDGLPAEYAEYEVRLTILRDYNRRGQGPVNGVTTGKVYTAPSVSVSNVAISNPSNSRRETC